MRQVSQGEFQEVLGHLRAELGDAKDDFQHGRMTQQQCQERMAVIIGAARKMNQEVNRCHVIMAAPMRGR